jgi:tRNA threonylcarbamoyladenosine biosynthesis protein TsaE
MIESAAAPLDIALPDLAATVGLAKALAARAAVRDVIALWGDLGLGKTTFARAFIQSRPGGESVAEVPSPTFTLVQVYELPDAPVWHFDLYRLTNAEDAWELGIEEAFATGITLIEWPDRLGGLLPAERLDVELQAGAEATARRARLRGHGGWAKRLEGLTFHA